MGFAKKTHEIDDCGVDGCGGGGGWGRGGGRGGEVVGGVGSLAAMKSVIGVFQSPVATLGMGVAPKRQIVPK